MKLLLDDWYIYGSEADGRIATIDPREEITSSGDRLVGSEFPMALNDIISPPDSIEIPSAMWKSNIDGISAKYQTQQRIPDFRRYEVKDHLGNVRTVIADYKNPFTTSGPVSNWTYLADIKIISNTYPYGKSYGTNAIYNAVDDYRYGFNGMEKEKNISSSGNTFDFGARVYDSEFPTFLSPDPIEEKLPANSTYSFAGANPINYIDYFGLQPGKVNSTTDYLIVGIQGFAKNSPKNNQTQTKNDARLETDYDGIASFMALDQNDIRGLKNVQTFVYSSSAIKDINGLSNTQNDIITTIRDYRIKNPEGKIIFVGHSEGAQQLVDLAFRVPEIRIDLTILVDIQAHKDISGETATHTAPNMVETKNFYVDGGTSYGGIFRQIFGGYEEPIGGKVLKGLFKNTNVENIPITGFEHTSIDQGISDRILKVIENFIEKNSSNRTNSSEQKGAK